MQAVDPSVRSIKPKYSTDDPGFNSAFEADQASIYALAAPFPDEDVEFAPFKSDASSGWAIVGPYVDVRAVRRRLNRVLGVGNWSFDLRSGDGGMISNIVLTLPSGKTMQGDDAASNTDIEAFKGGASSAMRRAAASVAGIGEYFYKVAQAVDPYFVDFNQDGNKQVDRSDAMGKLPKWARLLSDPNAFVKWAKDEHDLSLTEIRVALRKSDLPVNDIDEITRAMKGDAADIIADAA